MGQRFSVYAPASSANLSVGFDLLGLALRPVDGSVLGDEILIEQGGSGCELMVEGRYAGLLPPDPADNIVHEAYGLCAEFLGAKCEPVVPARITLRKNLPVCSGLGSSAASVVAAVLAADAVNGSKLSRAEQMTLMGQLEGKISGSIHYDNVAPCFLGGLQLILGLDGRVSERLPFFSDWLIVVCFPGIKISTAKAREILPREYPRATAITYARQLAAFVHACHAGDEALAAASISDVIAEPYREILIPGFAEAKRAGARLGAVATGISGSGSSIFSIFRNAEAAQEMKRCLERDFIANEDGFCHVCGPDEQGARVTPL
ncbi:MAG: homoserine kinase [Succinivibrionaceae bacterium]|nr:homoserine kinase [Succinivibrionaceae bacterium]